MSTTIVGEKGQVTIPKAIRDALGLRQGDRVSITLSGGDALISKAVEEDDLMSVVGIIDLGMSTDDFIELMRGPAK